jgi:hypothetical protein
MRNEPINEEAIEYERDDDPIIDEIRRIRAKQAASYGYDTHKQWEDTRRMGRLFGNDVVARSRETGRIEVVFKGTGKARFRFDSDASALKM